MPREPILVVYPPGPQRVRIQDALEAKGFQVLLASDAKAGWAFLSAHPPAAAILGNSRLLDGLDLCQRLRTEKATEAIPLIILQASGGVSGRLAAFDSGADDCLARPFTLRELAARTKALVRRSARQNLPDKILQLGDLLLDEGRLRVTYRGTTVDFSVVEFHMLWFLAMHPGRVLKRNEIVRGALGNEPTRRERAVDVHMVSIRQKLGSELIQTIPGMGYRLKVPMVTPFHPRRSKKDLADREG